MDESWQTDAPQLLLRHNGIPHTGIDVLLLWMTAQEMGYRSAHWMTFRQALELGGSRCPSETSRTRSA